MFPENSSYYRNMRYSRYFIVVAICGHVGRNNGIVKSFPVAAENAKHAAAVTRKFPRVKHDYKYAIQSVREVTKEEYLKQKEINAVDPYLLSKSKYEQNLNCSNLSVFHMEEIIDSKRKKYPPRYKKGRKRFDDELYEQEPACISSKG